MRSAGQDRWKAWGEVGVPRAEVAESHGDPNPAGKGAAKLGSTYWGPSARRRWGSPPAGEGRGSRGRPGGPGSSRTGQWSRPWLRGALLVHSPYLTTPCPPPPLGRHSPAPTALATEGRGNPTGSCQRTRVLRFRALRVRRTAPAAANRVM